MNEYKEVKQANQVKKQKDEFIEQAVLRKVETMQELVVLEPEIPEQEKPAENPQEFSRAIAFAQAEGKKDIEVTQKMFEFLVKNNPTKYLTYGHPGVRVYVSGTKDKIEKEEKMDAVAYANHVGKHLDESK